MGRACSNRAPRLGASAQSTVLGFDPGLARLGYGMICREGNRMRALWYGTLETPAGMPVPERLALLFGGIRGLLGREKPDAAAVEELFFSKNVKTAMTVAQARGVVLLACGLAGVPVFEVKPGQVKQAVTGYGRAEKGQVQRMVRILLGLAEDPKPDDTADALAVAIAHAQYPTQCGLGTPKSSASTRGLGAGVPASALEARRTGMRFANRMTRRTTT